MYLFGSGTDDDIYDIGEYDEGDYGCNGDQGEAVDYGDEGDDGDVANEMLKVEAFIVGKCQISETFF